MHVPQHWIAGIIDPHKKRILVIDCFYREKDYSKNLQHLKDFYRSLFNDKMQTNDPFDWKPWVFLQYKDLSDLPRQIDGNSCGVIMCMIFTTYATANRLPSTEQDFTGSLADVGAMRHFM